MTKTSKGVIKEATFLRRLHLRKHFGTALSSHKPATFTCRPSVRKKDLIDSRPNIFNKLAVQYDLQLSF
jgi:hypothetical protein